MEVFSLVTWKTQHIPQHLDHVPWGSTRFHKLEPSAAPLGSREDGWLLVQQQKKWLLRRTTRGKNHRKDAEGSWNRGLLWSQIRGWEL